jgi:hypothetical protein
MRLHGGTTFGTVCPLDGRFVVVRPAGAGSGVAMFSFRDCHKKVLKILVSDNKTSDMIAENCRSSIGMTPKNDIFWKNVYFTPNGKI